MGSLNGVTHANGNGTNGTHRQPTEQTNERRPRRLVLLTDGEQSEAGAVLLELRGEEISGRRLHAEIQKQSAANPGSWVAAEWLSNIGWTRFLWCKK